MGKFQPINQGGTMPVEHHPLVKEFPEHRERIHALKTSDHHFARLFNEYETVDKEIVRIEDKLEATPDLALEILKKNRLALKDQLYTQLRKGA
jgi:uncharacterized protein